MERFKNLDLSRQFAPNEQTIPMPTAQEITAILHRMGKFSPQDELNCGACGYDSCHDHAVAIHSGLAEIEMCLPYTIEQLRKTLKELAVSHEQLASVQAALIQSEKLASMGQLAAAVAHEVNNPLGVVLMYAHLLLEECDQDSKLRDDLAMIVEQTDRCKKIVAGLLNFARQKKVVRQPVNVCELIDRCLHTLPPPQGIEVRIQHRIADPVAELDADQIMQVLVNLVNNAYEAMTCGGLLTVQTSDDDTHVQFEIADTGVGISKENLSKVFEPFFTTKQLGKGTGLGLAITYGIVKMHRGDIRVESNADPGVGPTGTKFTVTLPREEQED
jgi:two-component system NtrC family sensor kinase